ncbi:MAG TPA: quinone-dependent dihydroorotate dehydrogenase [Candidatus Binataceae bacterium]|nr:quinone-dependent dihydroorotate dehydrogenase [Candidatus Binataceae bacterium]
MAPPTETFYHRVLRPLLFQLDPERAHRLTLAMMRPLAILRKPPPDPPALATAAWGIRFSNPIGLAAGMDKDIRAVAGWQALGFGFAELGTVTPLAQPGNPRPRLWRMPEDRALVNRLGFPSAGMEAAARRLQRLRRRGLKIRLGLNLGPNKDTPRERVASDYAAMVARLGAMADFIVINVSSPNTPGLRDWQSAARLAPLMRPIMGEAIKLTPRRPVLVKLAPDLNAPVLASVCEAVAAAGVDGLVACNTTTARAAMGVRSEHEGGLSGAPLHKRAVAMVAEIRRRAGVKMPIIGVGGVFGAEDAYRLICAGATLVELYTGVVYEGPDLVRRIKEGLLELLHRDGLSSIAEAVGRAAPARESEAP